MIYLKWLALTLLDWALLLTLPHVAPFTAATYWAQPWVHLNPAIICAFWAMALIVPTIAAFTGPHPYGERPYTWGGWWGTWDNPPQGDEGYVAERCPFPMQISGWRGYLNRCMWMIRNPLYGYARKAAVDYSPTLSVSYIGRENISDKYEIPGWYFARAVDLSGRVVAFEFYCVLPWGFGRCLRSRLGWKIMTDKFERYGFAQLVNTFNPFDGYGDKEKPLT